MAFDWKKTVAAVAPTIATAFTGPLGGLATKAVIEALGLPRDSTEDKIEAAIKNATPDQLLLIKNADNAFKIKMGELGVDLERIAASDRDSARRRETAVQDETPKILAVLVVIMWGLVQWHLLTDEININMREIVMRLLGTLDAAVLMVLAYYYGASAKVNLFAGGSAEDRKPK